MFQRPELQVSPMSTIWVLLCARHELPASFGLSRGDRGGY